MNSINNYGFRIINKTNPSKTQTRNRLAVNYCSLPASKMARRVASFIENNVKTNNNPLNKQQSSALLMFYSNSKNSFFSSNLTYNNINNSLQASTNELANTSNLQLSLLSAVNMSTTQTVSLDGEIFNVSYNNSNGYITITNENPDFNYTNYALIFNLVGYNLNQNFYVTYTLS